MLDWRPRLLSAGQGINLAEHQREPTTMAGESAQFGLRPRPPTPAIRAFDLMPRLRSMLDHANAALAQPFCGCRAGPIPSERFTRAQTGVSLAPLLQAAQDFLAKLTTEQRGAA